MSDAPVTLTETVPSQMATRVELYRKLYLIRRAEEAIIRHYPEDEMKTPMHMSMGQEAVAVGVCHALGPDDQAFASYRSHATFLAKTGDVERFFRELYGRVSGTAGGKCGSMHLSSFEHGHLCSSAIVASCLPVAVGAAFANKQKRNGAVACVFFGDGAADEGVFWESLNVACVMRLPVLFVCEDNGFAVHTPTRDRQGYRSLPGAVRAFNCRVYEEKTTDVEVIYQLARRAVSAMKTTGQPAFLQLTCYRYLEHVGIAEDFEAGYRPKAEFESWFRRDCVALQRKQLLDQGYPEGDLRRVEGSVDADIERSIAMARTAAFPEPDQLHHGVFHEKD